MNLFYICYTREKQIFIAKYQNFNIYFIQTDQYLIETVVIVFKLNVF